jgi:type I restriction enzyme, S subunit
MSEWKGYKLADVVEVKYGKAHQLLSDGNIPAYGSGGLMRYVDSAIYDDESILIPRKGTLNNILYKAEPFWTVDTMFWTKLNKQIVFPKFLFYQLTTFDFANMNVGSAVPSMTVPVLNDLDILVPPIKEQIAIAEVLSSLDDKIDLLHRQNKTLEQLAETLFRQWFVEEAEESWKNGKLEDIIVVKYGKDHKKLEDGKIPAYGSGGLMRYVSTALYSSESVLVPRKGSLNNVMYIDEPFWTVDTMFYTVMRKPNIAKFVFHLLKQQDLASMNVGSAVPSMTTEILNNMEVMIPPDSAFSEFESLVSEPYKKIKANTKQIKTLTQLRDTLLPKMMSGEVRVEME